MKVRICTKYQWKSGELCLCVSTERKMWLWQRIPNWSQCRHRYGFREMHVHKWCADKPLKWHSISRLGLESLDMQNSLSLSPFSYCSEASICPRKPVPTPNSCIFTHRVRGVLLCFEQCGSLLMTSQLSSGRNWCQNGQEDEESSAYYTGTATTAASLGSHEYLDISWPRLMCAPISDSYLTPLEGLTAGPCQAAPGAPVLHPVSLYSSLLKECLVSAS